jgi:hypothetical protein
MESTNFDLEATSAAIIFNKDMSTELVLPKMSDEEVVDFEENQNLFIAMAIASLLDDAGFRNYVSMKLETMFETMDAIRENNKGGCSDCGGGCCPTDTGDES